MVRAALAGALDTAPVKTDAVFGLSVPQGIDGVPAVVLDARETWKDAAAYDAQARKLAGMFRENIKKFGADVSEKILAAGPKG
jgi:phosphoenolpyruvate carboxykinase (ATP)